MRRIKLLALALLTLSGAFVSSQSIGAPMDEYTVTSRFGHRQDPMGGEDFNFHKGVDIVGPSNAPIKSVADGVVKVVWPAPDGYWRGHPTFGGMIVIEHDGGLWSLYGHLSETHVWEGDEVRRGQVIGRQGNTGVSTGEHLHFELMWDPVAMWEAEKEARLLERLYRNIPR